MSYALLFILFLKTNFLFAADDFNIGAYYENWSQFTPAENNRKPFVLDMVDPSLLTDLFYAFAIFGFETESITHSKSRLANNFAIQPIYPNDKAQYSELQKLKQRSGGKLRLFLSIGGENFNNPRDPFNIGNFTHSLFSKMVAKAENRKEFIDSAIAYAHQYKFDGIDIDWEYPGDLRRGGNEKDFENFPIFIKEFAQALHQANPPLLLSLAVSATVPAGVPKTYLENPDSYYRWIVKSSEYADRITVMAYNYHAPFDEPKITGANTPLFRDTDPVSTLFIVKTLQNFLDAGMPPKKMNLGIAIYGWLYKGVENLKPGENGPGKKFTIENRSAPLPYFKISDLIAKKKFTLGIDTLTNTAYSYNNIEKEWISFDVPETIALKAKEAKRLGLGGVVFWALNLDEYQWRPTFPNIRAAQM